MYQKLISRFANRKVLLTIFIFLAIFASFQSYFRSDKTFTPGGRLYTSYNNYVIFKQSHFHLIENKDLYQFFPEEHVDLYKYSPAFALIFGIFARLPDLAGLTLWNLLNVLVLFQAIYFLPKGNLRTKGFILLAITYEMLTSIQNEQSNALLTGLIIFGFCFLERRKYWLGTLCILLSVFIKLFGIVAFALFLLYPDKLKLAYTSIFWGLVLLFLPLLAIDFSQLIYLYESWGSLLEDDHSISDGFSVMGWLKTWFAINVNKPLVTFFGVILFCLTLIRRKFYHQYAFRILLLSSILIWVVIFNHRAESPTFIVALTGVSIWYFSLYPSKINLILFVAAFIFTGLAATDVFPAFVRNEWFKPYVVKAVPCILVWARIFYQMMSGELSMRPETEK